jgi:hypothetical protein
MNDLVNSLLLAMNENELMRAALARIAEDSYLDDHDLEFRPTSAAIIAKDALSRVSKPGSRDNGNN